MMTRILRDLRVLWLTIAALVGTGPQRLWAGRHALNPLLFSFLVLSWGGPCHAQTEVAAALTAVSEEGGSRQLPLVDETVSVRVEQGHASCEFVQTFQNETMQNLEGRYRIALGTVATATGFSYRNGEERIVGEIFEKEAARRVYEEVTRVGSDPGLLERTGEGVFSFRVAPIFPGEKKEVTVSTSQWLSRVGDTFELRLPLGRGGKGSTIRIVDHRPIERIWSPTHRLRIARTPGRATVTLEGPSDNSKPKPLVLRYSLDSAPFELSTALHRDDGHDAYLSVSVAAPELAPGPIASREVTLVLDRSGSMSGTPLAAASAAAQGVLQRLSEDDLLNVITFDDDVQALFAEPQRAAEAREEALVFLRDLESGGGTDLARALRTTFSHQSSSKRAKFVLFLTDGQSDASAALEAAHHAPAGLRLYTVGIGAGVDRPLLARLARDNRGRFTYVADESKLEQDVDQLYSRIESPVLSNLELSVEGAVAHHAYPRRAPDLFRKDQLVWSLRVRPNQAKTARVVLRGQREGAPFQTSREIDLRPQKRTWVGRAWASERVDDLLEQMALSGALPELEREALELALAYDLVTPYTSFLAIPESEISDAVRGSVEAERARRARVLEKHPEAARLSRSLMPPGDPLLSVAAPRSARGVVARFPFGLVLDLEYDPKTERWESRFLVPHDVSDGNYEIEIFIVDRMGQTSKTLSRYTIDSRPPAFEVRTTPNVGGVTLVVEADEELREVRLVRNTKVTKLAPPLLLDGRPCSPAGCSLHGVSKTRFEGRVELAPGTHRLRIVATDGARNEAVQIVEIFVGDDGC